VGSERVRTGTHGTRFHWISSESVKNVDVYADFGAGWELQADDIKNRGETTILTSFTDERAGEELGVKVVESEVGNAYDLRTDYPVLLRSYWFKNYVFPGNSSPGN